MGASGRYLRQPDDRFRREGCELSWVRQAIPLKMRPDAAPALLGHRSLSIIDTYAELDEARAVEAAQKLG